VVAGLSCEAPPTAPFARPVNEGQLEPLWVVHFYEADKDLAIVGVSMPHDVTVAPDGAAYLWIEASGSVVATGGLVLPTRGDNFLRPLLVRISPSGRPEWARPVTFCSIGCAIAAGPASELYVLTPASLRKLSAKGDDLWSLPLDGTTVYDLAVDPQGNAYVQLEDRLFRVSAGGTVQWTSNETAGSVATDELGRLLVAGEPVTALSAASGSLLWRADVGGHIAVYPGSGGEILVYDWDYDARDVCTLTRLAPDGAIRWQTQVTTKNEGAFWPEVAPVDADRALVGLTGWGAAPLLVDRQGHARALPLSTEMYWSHGIAAHPSGRAVITGQIACAVYEDDPLCKDPPPGSSSVVAMIELP